MIEYGVRAVAKLLRTRLDVEYNIIGEGPLRSELAALIEELGVSDRVNLLGAKHQQEVITLLDHSHISIAPSVTAKNGDQDAPVNSLNQDFHFGPGTVKAYTRAAPNTTSFRAEPCT